MSRILSITHRWGTIEFLSEDGQYIYSVISDDGYVEVFLAKKRLTRKIKDFSEIENLIDENHDEYLFDGFIGFGGEACFYDREFIAHVFGYTYGQTEFVQIEPQKYMEAGEDSFSELVSNLEPEEIIIEINNFMFLFEDKIIIGNYIKIISSKFKYKGVSLFSGAGLMDYPFHHLTYGEKSYQNVFRLIWANEFNRDAGDTYSYHYPNVELCRKDIRNVNKTDLPSNIEIDFLEGGWSCKGISELRTKVMENGKFLNENHLEMALLNDERNFLYKEYKRVLAHLKPKVFVAENVRNLVLFRNGRFINQIVKELQELDYRVKYELMDAKDYGDPQTRTRVFIVGIRNDLDLTFTYPRPSHGLNRELPYRTVRGAIGHLADNYGEYYKGDAIRPWLVNGYSREFMSYNRKVEWDRPSRTIKATMWNVPLHPKGKPMRKVGRNKYIFDGQYNRSLSVRECLALQSMPFNYYLSGGLESKYAQIGNGVPRMLGTSIARAVKDCLDGVEFDYCDHWCKKEKQKIKRVNFISQSEVFNITLCKDCLTEEFNVDWEYHRPENYVIRNEKEQKGGESYGLV